MDAAQIWFVAGTIPLIVAGTGHLVLALIDTVRPLFFTPLDPAVRPAIDATGIRLRSMFRAGDPARPSLWRVWLGIHMSHGLGIAAFGLLCLLIAVDDFSIVERIMLLQPLAVGFSAALLVLSLRFWFYGPALVTGTATLCFTVAWVLAA